MIVDAHQHFWELSRGDYVFPQPGDAVLYHDYMPIDLEPELAGTGVSQTILVQATDTVEESRFLLAIASQTAFVAGVVGWRDARRPEALDALRQLPHAERLVGVRPMLQRWDDVSWLLEDDSILAIRRLSGADLVFDVLVDARHLLIIHELARAVPRLRIVIDHMGKPWRDPDRLEAWQVGMRQLARLENCWVKISGYPFGSEAPEAGWRIDRLAAMLKEWFSSGRVVWGSDWPVVRRENSYGAALAAALRHFGGRECADVFAGNARRVYGLEQPPGAGGKG